MNKGYSKIIFLSIVITALVLSIVIGANNYKTLKKYKDVEAMIISKKYDQAILQLEELGDYRDSKEKIIDAFYIQGKYLFSKKKYEESIASFNNCLEYKDSKTKILEVKYAQAGDAFKNKNYDLASKLYEELGDYKDSVEKYNETVNLKSTP